MMWFEKTVRDDQASLIFNGVPIGSRREDIFASGVQGIIVFIELRDILQGEAWYKSPHGRIDFFRIVLWDDIQVRMFETRLVIVGFVKEIYSLCGVETFLDLLFRFAQGSGVAHIYFFLWLLML